MESTGEIRAALETSESFAFAGSEAKIFFFYGLPGLPPFDVTVMTVKEPCSGTDPK